MNDMHLGAQKKNQHRVPFNCIHTHIYRRVYVCTRGIFNFSNRFAADTHDRRMHEREKSTNAQLVSRGHVHRTYTYSNDRHVYIYIHTHPPTHTHTHARVHEHADVIHVKQTVFITQRVRHIESRSEFEKKKKNRSRVVSNRCNVYIYIHTYIYIYAYIRAWKFSKRGNVRARVRKTGSVLAF